MVDWLQIDCHYWWNSASPETFWTWSANIGALCSNNKKNRNDNPIKICLTFAIKQVMVNQYWITPVIRSAKSAPMNDHWAINAQATKIAWANNGESTGTTAKYNIDWPSNLQFFSILASNECYILVRNRMLIVKYVILIKGQATPNEEIYWLFVVKNEQKSSKSV